MKRNTNNLLLRVLLLLLSVGTIAHAKTPTSYSFSDHSSHALSVLMNDASDKPELPPDNAPPPPPVGLNPITVCAGKNGIYTAPVILGGATYTWTLPSGGTLLPSGNTCQVLWATTPGGPHNLSVKVFNASGLQIGSARWDATIKPIFDLLDEPAKTVCKGSEIEYTATSDIVTANDNYSWTVKDASGNTIGSSSGSEQFLFTWATPGTYTINVTNNSGSFCNDLLVHEVTVVAPIPAPVIADIAPVCPGSNHVYTLTPSSPIGPVIWTVTNGTPSSGSGTTANITWGPTGPYIIRTRQERINNPCPVFFKDYTIPAFSGASITIDGKEEVCPNTIEKYKVTAEPGKQYTWTLYTENNPVPGSILGSIIGSTINAEGEAVVTILWNNTSGNAVVTVTTTGCDNSTPVSNTFPVTIKAIPQISLTTASSEVCANTDVQFQLNASALIEAESYTWDFGDGTTTIETDPDQQTHAFLPKSPSTYLVKVKIAKAFGCNDVTLTHHINVKDAPKIWVSAAGPLVYCAGANENDIVTDLVAAVQSGATVKWFKYDNTTNQYVEVGTGSTYDVTQFGEYRAVVTRNGCSSTSNIIQIVKNPLVACNAGGPIGNGEVPPSCEELSPEEGVCSFTFNYESCLNIKFSGNVGNGEVLWWYFPYNNYQENGNNLNTNHIFPGPGSYDVILMARYPATNGGWCSKYVKQTVHIPVEAYFSSTISCGSGNKFNVHLTEESFGFSPVTEWKWEIVGQTQPFSTIQAPVVGLEGGHTYDIKLTITSGGVSCSIIRPVTLPKVPSLSLGDDVTVCEDAMVTFSATGNTEGIIGWNWNFGDGASNAIHPTRTYTNGGNYEVTLIVMDEFGCSRTFTKDVQVNSNTLAAVINPAGPVQLCNGQKLELIVDASGSTQTPYVYTWSTSANTQQIIVDQAGTYLVKVTDQAGCSKYSNPVEVTTTPCNECKSELALLSFACLGKDKNGNKQYWFNYKISWPGANGSPVTALINPMNNGTISNVSLTHLNTGSNAFSGIYTHTSGEDKFCFELNVFDEKDKKTCTIKDCLPLGECKEPVSCVKTLAPPKVVCAGRVDDVNQYFFKYGFEWEGVNYVPIIHTNSETGTITNISSIHLTTGWNNLTGMIHSNEPEFCFNIFVYNPVTEELCKITDCIALQECPKVVNECDKKGIGTGITNVQCVGEEQGGYLYSFDFNATNPFGSSADIFITSPQVGINSYSPVAMIGTTGTFGTGYFIDFGERDASACISIIISSGEQVCMQTICLELPECENNNISTGSNAINETRNDNAMSVNPNPASEQTVISYNFTEAADRLITITDMYGRSVKTFNINDSKGAVTLLTGSFNPGVYMITAFANNKPVGSKRLVIIK